MSALSPIHKLLAAILLLGLLGVGAELLLLGHVEDRRQWVPIVLIAVSLLVLGWEVAAKSRTSLIALRATMAVVTASGGLGLWYHYQGNVEFELEMYPGLSGFALFKEAVQGATPALAPGAMIQLGLLGLLYTYRPPWPSPGRDAPSRSGGTST
jgi:hypothetical protein